MTPLERVVTALSHREPDRVPLLLLLTMHGARELSLPLREYLSSPRAIVEAQPRMRARLGHDCFYGLAYATLEMEAWGGETRWFDDGPPNAGAPLCRRLDEIARLRPPRVEGSAPLRRGLEVIAGLREAARGEVPVLSAVLSPFSLPVLQLGFEAWLEVLLERPDLADHLLRINEEFCVEWANAQFAAGATALGYFDPVASPTCVPTELYRRLGAPVARRVLARVRGPLLAHLASARALPLVDDVVGLGFAGLSAGTGESLAALKRSCAGRLNLVGGLNGLALREASPAEVHRRVREAIAAAAPGGGFLLAEEHGEVPFQVEFEVLEAVAEATRTHGRHPLIQREREGCVGQ